MDKHAELNLKRNIDVEMLNSVWSIPCVNPYLDKEFGVSMSANRRHPAPFPEELAYRVIELFSSRGDIVLDPFCGSGTTSAVALKMGRNAIGYDISPEFINFANNRCRRKALHYCKSSENMRELKDKSVDLCFTSPPYLNVRHYTDSTNDIGNAKQPYSRLQNTIKEVFRVLKDGGTFCLNVADVRTKGGFLSTFAFGLLYLAMHTGFQLYHTVIWKKSMLNNMWNLMDKKIRYNHEYIWVFKKPKEVT